MIKSKRFYGPIWDVIATMPGVDTKHLVVTGGHRDAWTYGAVDPISGTVDLLQLGRALGKLKAEGWKPQRTIVIGSWDGEELNLFGSDEWVEQHAAELRAGCVAYINTDEVAFGPSFGVYATPELGGALLDAASAVTAPNGQPLTAYWKAQDKNMAVNPIGGGSDHEPFVFHENLPAAGATADRSAPITPPTTIRRRCASSIRACTKRPLRRAIPRSSCCVWLTQRIPICASRCLHKHYKRALPRFCKGDRHERCASRDRRRSVAAGSRCIRRRRQGT